MKNSGFTLIEILIALLIFAIMATIITMGLSNVLKVRQKTEITYDNIRQIQIFNSLMERDMTQIRPRAIINNNGTVQAALVGNFQRIEFTRGGLEIFNTFRQSNLQRVAYVFQNNQLLRLTWPVLDRAPGTEPSSHVILDNISNFRIQYIDEKGQTSAAWPSASADQVLPKAVIITFDYKNLGNIERIWIISN